jgi:hypothetical protein
MFEERYGAGIQTGLCRSGLCVDAGLRKTGDRNTDNCHGLVHRQEPATFTESNLSGLKTRQEPGIQTGRGQVCRQTGTEYRQAGVR